MGNSNPDWDEVKAGSEARCSCGNERLITPLTVRKDFRPSESGAVVVAAGSPVFLRPLGGDDASAYIRLRIEGPSFTYVEDPFSSFILELDMLKAKGWGLQQLADILPAQPTPPVFLFKAERIPLLAFNAVDMVARTVTITPDSAVEVFSPSQEAGTRHAC